MLGGLLSSIARLRFPGRFQVCGTFAEKAILFQRTATVPFLSCLSLGVHAIVPEERVPELVAAPLVVAQIRDKILTLITSKTFAELNSPAGKINLRKEIADGINPVLYAKGCAAKEVLFAEFVVQ